MAKFTETELGAYLNAKAISVIEPNVNYWSSEDVCVCVATISAKMIGGGLHVIGSWEAEKGGKRLIAGLQNNQKSLTLRED